MCSIVNNFYIIVTNFIFDRLKISLERTDVCDEESEKSEVIDDCYKVIYERLYDLIFKWYRFYVIAGIRFIRIYV